MVKSGFLSRLFLIAFFARQALPAQTRNHNGPFVLLKEARLVNTRYFGDNLAAPALSGSSGKPLSLATADFDEDGGPGLAAGYATVRHRSRQPSPRECRCSLASQNSIYSNAQLGIDIGPTGPQVNSNCNSTNNGANNLQNSAVLLSGGNGATTLISATATDPNGNTSEFSNCTAVASQAGNLNILGSLNSLPGVTYRIEFFLNSACDPSTFGQGQTFLTGTSVTTDANSCIGSFGVTPQSHPGRCGCDGWLHPSRIDLYCPS
jgi:hypothetical protein